MRVIVCGGRDYADTSNVRRALRYIEEGLEPEALTLVHGSCSGADRLAADEALRRGWTVEPHFAKPSVYGSPAAFHIRNQEMADAGADLLIAFPGGNGTANMVERAEKAGIPVSRWPSVRARA